MNNSGKNHIDEVYLAKWLNNELSDEGLSSYISENDLTQYIKIRESLQYFDAPYFDEKKTFSNIKNRLPENKIKVRTIHYKWIYAAAATIAILISTYFFTNSLFTDYYTNNGEQRTVLLDDGSEVKINANSNLTYYKNVWTKKREVTLEGEAFFKVKKGIEFNVKTKNGIVTVLGTQFNVNSQNNYFSVSCYEGKVKVVQKNHEIILTKGKAYQNNNEKIDKWDFNENDPGWLHGENSFKSTPLKIVISSLQNQYDISIIHSNINDDQLFTGSYSNDNLNVALKSVFTPMEIDYKIENKKVFLVKK